MIPIDQAGLDRSSRRIKVFLQSAFSWDFIGAFLAAGIGYGLWWRIEALELAVETLLAFAASSMGIALAAWEMKRQLIELLKTDAYGEIVRSVDPDSSDARRPFDIVIWIAFLSTFWCTILGVFVSGISNHAVEAVFVSVTVLLFTWATFGLVSLWMILREHERFVSEVTAARESLDVPVRTL